MSDTEFDIDTSKLTPANQNPWYILMTLYGEQEGDEIDENLHALNCEAWNMWVCQHMSEEARKEFEKVFIFSHITEFEYKNFISEISKKYLDNWKNRNGVNYALDDIPSPRANIDLSYTYFKKIFSSSNMIFSRVISFNNSVFEKEVCFKRSTFLKRINGDSSIFKGAISFDVSEFNGIVCLRRCEFRDISLFRNITVCSAFLVNDSVFYENSFFYLASFVDLALFDNSVFLQDVKFRGAKFANTVGFRSVKFNSEKNDAIISFEECIFSKTLSFYDASFKSVFPNFTGSIFSGVVVFSSHDHQWPFEDCGKMLEAKLSSAVIRHLLAKQGSPEDAHFFFRREMHFSGKIGSMLQRLPYLIYGWFSDYGYSIKRPTLALLLLWLIGSIGLATGFADLSSATNFTASIEPASTTAAALSFSNLFPFFGFTGTYFEPVFLRELPAPLKVLSAAQTVLSLPLLFFLGLGLRTRFRMR